MFIITFSLQKYIWSGIYGLVKILILNTEDLDCLTFSSVNHGVNKRNTMKSIFAHWRQKAPIYRGSTFYWRIHETLAWITIPFLTSSKRYIWYLWPTDKHRINKEWCLKNNISIWVCDEIRWMLNETMPSGGDNKHSCSSYDKDSLKKYIFVGSLVWKGNRT